MRGYVTTKLALETYSEHWTMRSDCLEFTYLSWKLDSLEQAGHYRPCATQLRPNLIRVSKNYFSTRMNSPLVPFTATRSLAVSRLFP
jgi:hypothetical protein